MQQKCLIIPSLLSSVFFANYNKEKAIKNIDIVSVVSTQCDLLFDSVQRNIKRYLPRSIRKNGNIGYTSSHDWTSGFFPKSLWYLYQLTQDEKWKTRAIDYTERIDSVKFYMGNHDIVSMMECSYGNLMNLELLFPAIRITRNKKYYDVAVQHADNTLKNHFRIDGSSFHELNDDTENGEVTAINTHQGKDESAWARGQAWTLYGYTVAYRETKIEANLEPAKKIALFIKNNPELPEDQVPYWDFDVEKTQDTPRDASAVAITASSIRELSGYGNRNLRKDYINSASVILNSLSSPFISCTNWI